MEELRPIRIYIADDDAEDLALIDLQRHLVEFNRRYGRNWSLTLPKRKPLKTPIGYASDNNHRLYQEFVDVILAQCPRPLTPDTIRQKLVDLKEKPTTAALVAPAYFRLITKVLDPKTKKHRAASTTLIQWGEG